MGIAHTVSQLFNKRDLNANERALNCSDLDLRVLFTAPLNVLRASALSSNEQPKERSFLSRKSDSLTYWIWKCNDTLDCMLCDFMTHCYFLVEGIKIPTGPCSILEKNWKPKLEIEEAGAANAALRISDYTSSSKSSSLYRLLKNVPVKHSLYANIRRGSEKSLRTWWRLRFGAMTRR